MDVAQITELRAWAARLEERSSSDELKAAGKAIAMLVNEVEELQVKLVSAHVSAPPPPAGESPPAVDPPWAEADDRLHGSFLSRLKRTFGFE